MATKATITVKGFEKYLEDIFKAGRDVDQIVDKALIAAGDVFLAGMKSRVPVDTGHLLSNVTRTDPLVYANKHVIYVGVLDGVDKETAIQAVVVEFGSVRTPAQSFVRKTQDEDKRAARRAMVSVFKANGMDVKDTDQ